MVNNAKMTGFLLGADGSITAIGDLPVASADYRDCLAKVMGAAGSRDRIYACMKSDADTFSWVEVVNGGI